MRVTGGLEAAATTLTNPPTPTSPSDNRVASFAIGAIAAVFHGSRRAEFSAVFAIVSRAWHTGC
jgi:hypothetical protein